MTAVPVEVSGPSQSGVRLVDTRGNSDELQQPKGHHPVSSVQNVGEPTFESTEIDDTAELNINDAAVITIIKDAIDELAPDHSSSVSQEDVNSVSSEEPSYLYTLEGCRIEIDVLRSARETLSSTITENGQFLGLLQSDSDKAKNNLGRESRERDHWEQEYHRCDLEAHNLEERGE